MLMAAKITSLSPNRLSLIKIFNPKNPNPQFTSLHYTSDFHLQASRRISNFPQDGDHLVGDSRNWSRHRGNIVARDYSDDEDEEEEDRSIDLLVKFVQNVFKKVSRKARKAVRSVLPIAISRELVDFSVDGVIVLTFFWLLKALLEVICTLGSVVFVSIILIRGVWTGISYLQDNRSHRTDDNERDAWSGAQPAT